MNPYATALGDENPIAVMTETPEQLRTLVGHLGPRADTLNMGPGKWTARELISHLADCEIAFAFRLRQALAEPNHIIQPFDQDAWAKTYAAYDIPSALNLFASLRGWNVTLVRSLPPDAFKKPVTHPERGTMTFQELVGTIAGHDLHHLRQLENMAAISGASASKTSA